MCELGDGCTTKCEFGLTVELASALASDLCGETNRGVNRGPVLDGRPALLRIERGTKAGVLDVVEDEVAISWWRVVALAAPGV